MPNKYHITIDGQGYILLDETYSVRAQRSFSPRFATGDASFGDLSFWQFLTQESFQGSGQEDFDESNKYLKAYGFTTKRGKPTLSPQIVEESSSMPVPEVSQDPVLYSDFTSAGLWTTSGTQIFGFIPSESIRDNFDVPLNTFSPSVFAPSHSARGSVLGDYNGFLLGTQTEAFGEWKLTFISIRDGDLGNDPLDTNYLQWYFLYDTPSADGYRIKLFGPNGNNISLVRIDAGIETVLATGAGAITFPAGTGVGIVQADQTITITRDDAGQFIISVNGVVRITHTDLTHTTSTAQRLYTSTPGPTLDDDGFLVPTAWHTVTEVFVPTDSETARGLSGILNHWENQYWLAYPDSSADFTFTTLRQKDTTNFIPALNHINAFAATTWIREFGASASNVHLIASKGNIIKAYNGTTAQFTSATLSFVPTCLQGITNNILYAFGTNVGYSGDIYFARLLFNAASWTVTIQTSQVDSLTGSQGVMVNTSAVDLNGTAWFAFSDLDPNSGLFQSRLIGVTAVDAAATNSTISTITPMGDFVIRSLGAIEGVVYMFGFRIEGKYYIPAIATRNGTIIWESDSRINASTSGDAFLYNAGIASIFHIDGGINFLTSIDGKTGSVIKRLTIGGIVSDIATFPDYQFNDSLPTLPAIGENYGRSIIISPRSEKVAYTTLKSGSQTLGGIDGTLALTLSKFGANTPLIDKTLYAIKVKLSEALTVSSPMTIKVNGVTIGTMTDADGTEKTILTTLEITGSDFQPVMEFPKLADWEGEIDRFTLQYVPTQFKKKAWSFTIRADENLQLVNGQREPKDGAEILAALQASWEKNVPISYTDTDGQIYNVIITDFSARQPIQHAIKGRREYLVTVEMLEV